MKGDQFRTLGLSGTRRADTGNPKGFADGVRLVLVSCPSHRPKTARELARHISDRGIHAHRSSEGQWMLLFVDDGRQRCREGDCLKVSSEGATTMKEQT